MGPNLLSWVQLGQQQKIYQNGLLLVTWDNFFDINISLNNTAFYGTSWETNMITLSNFASIFQFINNNLDTSYVCKFKWLTIKVTPIHVYTGTSCLPYNIQTTKKSNNKKC